MLGPNVSLFRHRSLATEDLLTRNKPQSKAGAKQLNERLFMFPLRLNAADLRLKASRFYSCLRATVRLRLRNWRLSSFRSESLEVKNDVDLRKVSSRLTRLVCRPAESIYLEPPSLVDTGGSKKLFGLFARFRRVELPEAFVVRVPQAQLYGRGFSVIHHRTCFRDCFWEPRRIAKGIPETKARCDYFPGSHVLLGMEHWHNYYHWMTDVLPRWQLLEEAGLLDAQTTLVVPKLNQDFQRDSLEFLHPGLKLKEFDGENYRFEELYFLSALNPINFSSSRNIEWIRKRFCSDEPVGSHRPERLYISRRRARSRRFVNEDEFLPYVEERGFKIVYPESFSLADQIRLFRNANCVVAPHGAGLTNMMFMPPGSKIVEIFPPIFPKVHGYQCYWSMARACGHRYLCLSGVSQSAANSDFRVALEDARAVLDRLADA
jgi:capsular polysaccharide biosynthesis protein